MELMFGEATRREDVDGSQMNNQIIHRPPPTGQESR